MRLTKLHVENYRALRNCDVSVTENLTVIIGKNNTGKTSLLGVLSKFLCNKSFVYDDLNDLAKRDFYNEVTADEDSLTPTFPSISLILVIAYSDKDPLKNIRPLLLDLDEHNNEVAIRFSRHIDARHLESCRAEFKSYCSNLNRGCSQDLFDKFMSQRHNSYFQTEAVPVYCKEGEIDPSKKGSPLKPDQIRRIISFDSVDALRGVSNKESSSTLGDRISNYYSTFKSTYLKTESNHLLDMLLKEDEQLNTVYKDLFSDLLDPIKQFGDFKESGASPAVISHLSEQDLLTNNTAVTYRSTEGDALPESHNGLGYMNVISIIMDMTAKSAKFRDRGDSQEPSEINTLFVEEPEAHTHPQLQTIFIRQLKKLIKSLRKPEKGDEISLQCLLTTHSANIVANASFEDIRYFVRANDESIQVRDLNNLEAIYGTETDQDRANYKFIKQYLTLDRADIFFADKVVLIEGDTERILMPSMMSKLDALHSGKNWNPLLSQEISIIPVGGAYANIFLPLVNFLGLKTLIITDSDYAKGKKSCTFDELEKTSNPIINSLLPSETKDADSLKKLYSDERAHIFSCADKKGNQWEAAPIGTLYLTFQTGSVNGYHPRSFEDAFINENRSFLKENIDSFNSLKSERAKDCFKDSSMSPYDLAQKIDRKSSFAMDILLAELGDLTDSDDNKWKVPSYIERGLKWLAQG